MTAEEGWSGPGTVALQTVGCKLNQAETDSLARKFLKAGYQVVAPDDVADIYLLNTCTVTHIADRKCRKLLRLAHRRNPCALIAATGCYAQRAPQELAGSEGVELVIGNGDKDKVVEIIENRLNEHRTPVKREAPQRPHFRTRAMVGIQEGCSQPCSFCIVPRVRGPEKSRPREELIADVRERVAEGYKEVILTGTRIGRYNHDSLPGLIKSILAKIDLPRLRLSSLEPPDLTPDLLGLWEDRRLCPHIHLPLQSGSDTVLKRMRRSYSTAEYRQAVALAREAIPGLSLTTDIMVGFPGESEEEFTESYRFCERTGFAGMHVFPYSPRPGTGAANMENTVSDREKKRRSRLMLDLARRSSLSFQEQLLGRDMKVLWETKKGGTWYGLTDNYFRVFLSSREPLGNELLWTNILAREENGLRGELADREIETQRAGGL